jgi:hypothetical protein
VESDLEWSIEAEVLDGDTNANVHANGLGGGGPFDGVGSMPQPLAASGSLS